MSDNVQQSSESDEWATPWPLFAQMQRFFGNFDLDPAANERNAKTQKFFDVLENGLAQEWEGRNVFVNPPFSRKKHMPIRPWIEKAHSATVTGEAKQVVLLIPANTGIRVWHDVIWPHARMVAFIKGRIHFIRPDGTSGPATFDSAIVRFGGAPHPQWIMAWEQPHA